MKTHDAQSLIIDCTGLSKKRINELADELFMIYQDVYLSDVYVIVDTPLGTHNSNEVADLLDRYGIGGQMYERLSD